MRKVDLKVVLLGSVSVGKSCLCERFLHERFTKDSCPTIGAAFGTKEVNVEKRTKLNLGVWDTAGHERYESMTRHYFQGADVAIICYDLTDCKSFEKLQHWVSELLKVEEDCILCMVGTKFDLLLGGHPRGVSKEKVVHYARSMNALHFETSSKTGKNCHEPFIAAAKVYHKKPKAKTKDQRFQGAVSFNNNDFYHDHSSGGGGCCQ
jgi:Ras-related protein Rab-24